MIRTQLQLDDEVYGQLRQFAIRQHRSIASCIRDAIGQFMNQAEGDCDDLSEIAGKFRPLPMDGVKDHDRVWVGAVIEARQST